MQDSPFKNITIPTVGNPSIDVNSDALDLGTIITILIPWIYGAAGIILTFNIISSGLKMMTSGGDPKALQGAQAKLSGSAIGMLILFTSFWIVRIIMQFFGLNMQLFN